jgi:hypothetical protein
VNGGVVVVAISATSRIAIRVDIEVFVDSPITVVIDSIAHLWCARVNVGIAVIAVPGRPTSYIAVSIGIESFVYLSIAVVIYPIADLCSWRSRGARKHSVHATC